MTAHEGVEPVRARTDSDATIAPGDAPVDHDLKLKAADEAADLEGSTAVGGKKGLRFWLVFACLLLATFNAAVEQTGASCFPSACVPASPTQTDPPLACLLAISTALPTIADDLNGSDYAWIANVFMICSAAVIRTSSTRAVPRQHSAG